MAFTEGPPHSTGHRKFSKGVDIAPYFFDNLFSPFIVANYRVEATGHRTPTNLAEHGSSLAPVHIGAVKQTHSLDCGPEQKR